MVLRCALISSIVALVILAAAMTLALITSRSALARGQNEVRRAEIELRTVSTAPSPTLVFDRVEGRIDRANEDFQQADNRLGWFAPILTRLYWVPAVGGQIAASPRAARLAVQISEGGQELLRGIRPVIAGAAPIRPDPVSLPQMVQRVAAGRAHFGRSCQALQAAQETRRGLGAAGSSTLASALRTFDRELPPLLAACRGFTLLPGLLGYPQPYTYLFAYQDSEEIKATGGFIGSMALVTVEGGKVRQEFQGTDVRDNLSVPPPEPMQLYNRDFAWLFRDANWSPDFPTSAQLERYFLRLDFHRDVAGVVNLTPQAIGDVLAATGPVYSPEYGQWIRSDNVARLADYYAHWTNGWGGPQQFANADTRRKQFMQIVAQHILTKMSSLSPAQWIGLLKELSQAVGRRDILVYFTDPEAERLARLTGADGEINRTSSDYLYVVDTNFSYNKLSKYVHTAVTYNVRVRPDRWLDAHLTVSYRNVGAPASLERQGWWGPGAGRLGAWNDYASFLRIFVPAGAEILSQSGWYQPWTPGSAYGKTMFSGYVIVRAGRTSTVRLHYVVPPNVFNASHGREYRLTVQHQPGSLPGRWAISVAAGGKQILSRVVPHPVGDLTAAAAVQPGPYTPIPLTRDGSGVVAPGHVIEPHAYLRAPGP